MCGDHNTHSGTRSSLDLRDRPRQPRWICRRCALWAVHSYAPWRAFGPGSM